MALSRTGIDMSLSWAFTNSVVTGARAIEISDSLSLVNVPAVATYNRVMRKYYSIASAGTQVIDLASWTDDYNAGAAVVLTKAIGIILTGTQAFRIEPNNAANPLPWIFGISTNYLTFGADEGFAALKAVTFTTGSKLLLTNQGGSAGTYSLAIIGGT